MTTNIITATTTLTMSSLEIAGLVESEHKHVKRSMERLADRGTITLSPLGTVPNPGPGPKVIEVYWVGKRDSYIVVAQLSPEFTARLVDRWQELEAQAAFNIPQTLPDALRLAADLAEQNAALEAKVAADRPKVEFAEAIRNLDGSCLVREFAKVMGTGQNRLFKQLREMGFLMANNQPYQEYIDRGWFIVVEGTPFTDSQGKSHPTFTTRITGKGQVGLEKKLRKPADESFTLVGVGSTHKAPSGLN